MTGKDTAAKRNIAHACTPKKKKNFKLKRKLQLRFEDSAPPPHNPTPHDGEMALNIARKLLSWVITNLPPSLLGALSCVSSLFLADGPGSLCKTDPSSGLPHSARASLSPLALYTHTLWQRHMQTSTRLRQRGDCERPESLHK